MIRIVPINRNGISHVVEYDSLCEKKTIQAMMGIVQSSKLKLGVKKVYGYVTSKDVQQYGDIVHYFNARGEEVAHSGLHLDRSPNTFIVFDEPRQWADSIKKEHEFKSIQKQLSEMLLQVAQSN